MKVGCECPSCGAKCSCPADCESWEQGIVSIECDACGEAVHQKSGLLLAVPEFDEQTPLLSEARKICRTEDIKGGSALLKFFGYHLREQYEEIARLRTQLEAM